MSKADKRGIKVYKNHVAFYGSSFSNFATHSFIYDGVEYPTSEHCFMAQKALFFNDKKSFEKILKAETPKEAKAIGRQVKNFDTKEWSGVRFDAMYNAVYAKFSQNKDLKELLLSEEYKGKGFVEGSPFDGIWGVKMDWRNSLIDDESNWQGLNLLGKVLDKVREDLTYEIDDTPQ